MPECCVCSWPDVAVMTFAVLLQLVTNQRCMISSACPTLMRMEKIQTLDSKSEF